MKIYPSDALYVETVYYKNKVWRNNELIVADDTNNRVAPRYHMNYVTYLKFPVKINPADVSAIILHLYNKKFAFVGSTVEVSDAALQIDIVKNWTNISGARQPPIIDFAGRFVIANCSYFGNYCGAEGRNQVGPWYHFGWLKLPLGAWEFDDGYLCLRIAADAPNNYYVFDNKENKPYIEIIEHTQKDTQNTHEQRQVNNTVTVQAKKLHGVREILLSYRNEKYKVPCSFNASPGDKIKVYPKRSIICYELTLDRNSHYIIGFPWRVEVVVK